MFKIIQTYLLQLTLINIRFLLKPALEYLLINVKDVEKVGTTVNMVFGYQKSDNMGNLTSNV